MFRCLFRVFFVIRTSVSTLRSIQTSRDSVFSLVHPYSPVTRPLRLPCGVHTTTTTVRRGVGVKRRLRLPAIALYHSTMLTTKGIYAIFFVHFRGTRPILWASIITRQTRLYRHTKILTRLRSIFMVRKIGSGVIIRIYGVNINNRRRLVSQPHFFHGHRASFICLLNNRAFTQQGELRVVVGVRSTFFIVHDLNHRGFHGDVFTITICSTRRSTTTIYIHGLFLLRAMISPTFVTLVL